MTTDTQNHENQSPEDFLKAFSEQLNIFMEQTVHLHNRVSELEVAIAYLLSKDPQWVENFQKEMAKEAKPSDGADSAEEKLVEPE